MNSTKPDYPWLKNRGYPHISPQLNLSTDRKKILSIVHNTKFISKYAFLPLIHSTINERRYKRIDPEINLRSHTKIDENGFVKKNLKTRPLHYASHLDAIIFGYYADVLLNKYEIQLSRHDGLADCITAYRRIPVLGSEKNKSTIHFAHEAFNEIKVRAIKECEVLKFDIKSFFSRMDHDLLKKAWAGVLDIQLLPDDHYNIFKAATRFSYILKDDLRLGYEIGKKRQGFDEKKLAQIRKTGLVSFFSSFKDFRDRITDGSLKLHRFPFKNDEGKPVGIPQGLPISAVLANLYLLNFDLSIFNELVTKMGIYYRRYSDDIILICKPTDADYVEEFVYTLIKESKVEMSKDKTERFLFVRTLRKEKSSLISIKITKSGKKTGVPFSYLGFEFYGDKTLIKSSNIAKFYRRMIRSVKNKSKLALALSRNNPDKKIFIHRRQLYKLYTRYPLNSNNIKFNFKHLVKNERGDFVYEIIKRNKVHNSNYLSYVHRASAIMEEAALKLQIRNHSKVFNQAINKHLKRAKEKSTH